MSSKATPRREPARGPNTKSGEQGKISKAELDRRVTVVIGLMAQGVRPSRIFQVVSDQTPWSVTERTVWNYIRRANRYFEKQADVDRSTEVGKALERLEDLYSKAYLEKDWEACRRIQGDLSSLFGIEIKTPGPGDSENRPLIMRIVK